MLGSIAKASDSYRVGYIARSVEMFGSSRVGSNQVPSVIAYLPPDLLYSTEREMVRDIWLMSEAAISAVATQQAGSIQPTIDMSAVKSWLATLQQAQGSGPWDFGTGWRDEVAPMFVRFTNPAALRLTQSSTNTTN